MSANSKRITDYDFVNSLSNVDSFFVSQNNALKQINKSDVFGITPIVLGGTGANNVVDARNNLELGSVATENIIPISKGGTGSSNGAEGLQNMFASGVTILSSNQYGDELPEPGIAGRIFFKKVEE